MGSIVGFLPLIMNDYRTKATPKKNVTDFQVRHCFAMYHLVYRHGEPIWRLYPAPAPLALSSFGLDSQDGCMANHGIDVSFQLTHTVTGSHWTINHYKSRLRTYRPYTCSKRHMLICAECNLQATTTRLGIWFATALKES